MNRRLEVVNKYFKLHPFELDQGTYACQKLVTSLLKELNEICEREGLSYFLYGGGLIGAVRHDGFVPWDDDIDIVMNKGDLDKLKKVLTEGGNSKYVFTKPIGLHKLRIKNYPAVIDVLPSIETSSDMEEIEYRLLFYKLREIALPYYKTEKEDMVEDVLQLSYNQPYGKNKFISTLICNPYENNHIVAVPYNKIYPLKKIKLLDTYAYIPRDPEYVLNIQFGDFYEVPIFRKDVHVNHKIAIDFCTANGIDIIGPNKINMMSQYEQKISMFYNYIVIQTDIDSQIIASLMEYKGIGTDKNIMGSARRLCSIRDGIKNDASCMSLLYDVFYDTKKEEYIRYADEIIEKSHLNDSKILFRKGKTAINTKNIKLFSQSMLDLSKLDMMKELKLIDFVMGNQKNLEFFNIYDACTELSKSGVRKAIAYKYIMEVYGIHCSSCIDFEKLEEITSVEYIGSLFFEKLWELRDISPQIFFIVCSSTNSDTGLRYGYLGRAYRDQIGTEKNQELGLIFFKKAADKGVEWAKIEYYQLLMQINSPLTLPMMIKYAENESSKGNLELRARLARAYKDGKGVEKDLIKSAELFESILMKKPQWAKWDYFDVMWEINDENSDIKMFNFALSLAKSGQRDMQARVGKAYRYGRGVKKDLSESIFWLRKASEQNLSWAKNELFDTLCEIGTEASLMEAYDVIEKHAIKGNGAAMGRLARAHRYGYGTIKDMDKAIYWYKKAISKGIGWANDELNEVEKTNLGQS